MPLERCQRGGCGGTRCLVPCQHPRPCGLGSLRSKLSKTVHAEASCVGDGRGVVTCAEHIAQPPRCSLCRLPLPRQPGGRPEEPRLRTVSLGGSATVLLLWVPTPSWHLRQVRGPALPRHAPQPTQAPVLEVLPQSTCVLYFGVPTSVTYIVRSLSDKTSLLHVSPRIFCLALPVIRVFPPKHRSNCVTSCPNTPALASTCPPLAAAVCHLSPGPTHVPVAQPRWLRPRAPKFRGLIPTKSPWTQAGYKHSCSVPPREQSDVHFGGQLSVPEAHRESIQCICINMHIFRTPTPIRDTWLLVLS